MSIPMIRAKFTAPTGEKCIIWFKTKAEGERFATWLEATLKAAYNKGKEAP